MGFEPTTFCMASSFVGLRGSAAVRVSPANCRFRWFRSARRLRLFADVVLTQR
jgi:hypothetical protein